MSKKAVDVDAPPRKHRTCTREQKLQVMAAMNTDIARGFFTNINDYSKKVGIPVPTLNSWFIEYHVQGDKSFKEKVKKDKSSTTTLRTRIEALESKVYALQISIQQKDLNQIFI